MQDFEKLGVFYLGRRRDERQGTTTEDLILYDSKDLTTHAVVVGMTGSGKTGLCITMLEEAALDRIPSLVIDPKGDLSNLLLTFPDLNPTDFRPWIDEGDAERAGQSPDQFAASEAKKWQDGLAAWGQDGNRIRTLRNAVEMRIYTPGSNAGRPLSILKSFAAPSVALREDEEAFRERIAATTSGLLALIGIDADPIRSREHILITKIFESAWSAGKDLDLARLITQIQSPPFSQVGVLELDKFFPARDRNELAMALNNLLASPTFASWSQGEPLDIKRLLHTDQGQPCLSIMSIAHLSESQQMFFVTTLLNEVLSWVRSQTGTSSLRAILYMDEIFGFFPPTANPPSKPPMLRLLKQSRAFGLGIVVATQNPVDLDYKGLANAGTWFLGRLQTERDKTRVLEGLEGASAAAAAAFDRSAMEATLAGLSRRIFLMNNVHENQPVVFETRWAMSYLCGPLSRSQIQRLSQSQPAETTQPLAPSSANESSNAAAPEPVRAPVPPSNDVRESIPSEIAQVFAATSELSQPGEQRVYRPGLMAQARLHYSKSAADVDLWLNRTFIVELVGDMLPEEIWGHAEVLDPPPDVAAQPEPDSPFAALPEAMGRSKQYAAWEKDLRDYLYRESELVLWACTELKIQSEAGESEGDFRIRLEQMASEKRDLEVEKLRKKFAPRFQTLQDRRKRAADRVEIEKEQYQQQRLHSILHTGSTILGALLGRKKLSATNVSKASTSARSIGRAASQRGDIDRAEESVEAIDQHLLDLQAEFDTEVSSLSAKLDVAHLSLKENRIRPRKTDIQVAKFAVIWLPYWQNDKTARPAFRKSAPRG